MVKKASKKSLIDAYQFDNFKTGKTAKGRFGDKTSLVLSFSRRSKKVYARNVAFGTEAGTTESSRWSGICHAVTGEFIWNLRLGAFAAVGPAW
jgi:hypothetical protein